MEVEQQSPNRFTKIIYIMSFLGYFSFDMQL